MGLQSFSFFFNINFCQYQYNNKLYIFNKNITHSKVTGINIINKKKETLKCQTKPVHINRSASVIVTNVPNYTN